jgi:hypothetical protein
MGRARSSPVPTFRLADGRMLEWASRRHRKGGGDRLGRWIAVLFIVGSACFAVGSLAGYSSLVGARGRDHLLRRLHLLHVRGVPAVRGVHQRRADPRS